MLMHLITAIIGPDPADDPTSNTALKNWLLDHPYSDIDDYLYFISENKHGNKAPNNAPSDMEQDDRGCGGPVAR